MLLCAYGVIVGKYALPSLYILATGIIPSYSAHEWFNINKLKLRLKLNLKCTFKVKAIIGDGCSIIAVSSKTFQNF